MNISNLVIKKQVVTKCWDQPVKYLYGKALEKKPLLRRISVDTAIMKEYMKDYEASRKYYTAY